MSKRRAPRSAFHPGHVPANKTHGESGHGPSGRTAEYTIWVSIKGRCLNPTNSSYHWYGGRGVTICDDWADSFERFLLDMGRRPSPQHSVDRLDNSKGYEPGNCRWATAKEQARNRRTSRTITLNGVTRTIAEWSEVTGIPVSRLGWRLHRGMTPEQVLSTSDRRRPIFVTRDGETRSLREWATLTGIKFQTLHVRYRKGWPIERLLSR